MTKKKASPAQYAALVCLSFGIAFYIGTQTHQPMTREEMDSLGAYKYPSAKAIEKVSLMDSKENPFGNEQLKGKWDLLFFGYTYCPDICPTTMASLTELDKRMLETELANQLQVVLVSVDPERDTPEKLDAYVSYFGEEYKGVTGEISNIRNFATQLSVRFQKHSMDENGNYLVDHSGQIAIVDPDGQYHGFLRPPFNIENMSKALMEMHYQFEAGI